MKKILLLLSILSIVTITDAQCYRGYQGPVLLNPQEEPGADAEFAGQTSVDPNEIIGPQGFDSLQWVSINDVLNYTIYFENDPQFATANAQRVDVRFDFQQKELMKDFTLGGYGFANMSWEMEKAANTYQTRLNLVDTMNIYVDLMAGLDVTRKQAFWKFSSIDPESGFAPWQHDRGLLPVNDSTHVGEGFVRFSIKPVSTMHTGDTISIQANIVFDENDTIPTNRWKNVVDAGMPTSRVTATVDASDEHLYRLKFEAADDEKGSGVKQVYLYLANQFGTYEEYAVCAPDSIITVVTEPGRSYEFYSLAEDNVGNREPLKEQADVVLNNNVAPTDITLSATKFQDDIQAAGFIAEISSVDTEENGVFTYALAEGDGAIHNDLFQVEGSMLQAKESFKCADQTTYKIRLMTTDRGGLTFSKAFELSLENVLVKPKTDTLNVEVCNGETFLFHGVEYSETGVYHYSKGNDYMCDSTFVINLTVRPRLEAPTVTTENVCTLVSSAEHTQWFHEDGTPVEDAIGQRFTPTEDGTYYAAIISGNCYSEPSQAFRVVLSDNMELSLNLMEGWNWVSSNLADDGWLNAKHFLQPIEGITERLVGQSDELINDPVYGLTGNLTAISPTAGYKLKVSQNAENLWSGNASKPETTQMSLHKGWNWIGYVPVRGNSLNDALSGLAATPNDIIKSLDDFAIYTGSQWIGTITAMNPGEGYLYQANSPATFTYPVQRVFPVAQDSQQMAHALGIAPWSYDAHSYPDNMTLIGRVVNESQQNVIEGTYTVGAFCDGECRGIGKYVDGLLFMTIHGTIDSGQSITFLAYENVTGITRNISESVVFNGQQEGTYNSPFALHISDATGIDVVQQSNGYVIYPKPLRNRLYINGNTQGIKSVKVLSSDGAVNISQDGYPDDGIDVSMLLSGVYVVAVIPVNGNVYYEKVIKAQNK